MRQFWLIQKGWQVRYCYSCIPNQILKSNGITLHLLNDFLRHVTVCKYKRKLWQTILSFGNTFMIIVETVKTTKQVFRNAVCEESNQIMYCIIQNLKKFVSEKQYLVWTTLCGLPGLCCTGAGNAPLFGFGLRALSETVPARKQTTQLTFHKDLANEILQYDHQFNNAITESFCKYSLVRLNGFTMISAMWFVCQFGAVNDSISFSGISLVSQVARELNDSQVSTTTLHDDDIQVVFKNKN